MNDPLSGANIIEQAQQALVRLESEQIAATLQQSLNLGRGNPYRASAAETSSIHESMVQQSRRSITGSPFIASSLNGVGGLPIGIVFDIGDESDPSHEIDYPCKPISFDESLNRTHSAAQSTNEFLTWLSTTTGGIDYDSALNQIFTAMVTDAWAVRIKLNTALDHERNPDLLTWTA